MSRHLIVFIAVCAMFPALNVASVADAETTGWQRPDQDILDVVHAPQLPWVWTSPTGWS